MPSDPPAFATVHLAHDGAVATLTMNRPERRNALSPELDEDLRAALAHLAADATVRAVVLTGAGAGFCAGADLAAFAGNPTPDAVYHHLTTRYQPLIEALVGIEKPVIAAVNGGAVGAGAGLALACDLRVMADDAYLMLAFSHLGLVPDAGVSWLLARQVGYSRAFEMAAEGRRIGAEECEALGLANRRTAPGRLLADAQAWATRLAARPTRALGLTKHVLHHALTASLSDAIDFESRTQGQCITTHDHREGIAAFLEKRPPRFEGR